MIKTYKDLVVWQKAVQLVKELYSLTEKFPREEQFVITAQMRRAAISMPPNIAEGKLRSYKKKFRQFLLIAYENTQQNDFSTRS